LSIQPIFEYAAGVTSTRWLTDTEQLTWRAFLEASQRLFEVLDHELQRDRDMPLAYYQILAMLSEAPDRTMRMSDLAAVTWSSRSRLSHAVDRLEDKGWIERASCPSDRRGAYAVLTDAGFAVLQSAAPSHVSSVWQHVFASLSPEQVTELGSICRNIAAGLSTSID
jgi:DNA-binding MarR family transcriptional regulator